MKKTVSAKGIANIFFIIFLLIVSLSAVFFGLYKVYRDAKKKESEILKIEKMVVVQDPETKKLISDLKVTIDSLTDKNKGLIAENKKVAVDNDKLKKQLGDMGNQVNFLTSSNTRLESQFMQEKANYEDSLRKIEGERSKLDDLLNKKRTEADNDRADFTKRINALNQELNVTRQDKEKLETLISKNSKDKLVIETAKMHYNLGNLFVEAKKYKDAMNEYKRAIELNPNDAESHYNLAVIYDIYAKDFNSAIMHYQECLRLNPRYKEKKHINERVLLLSLKEAVKKDKPDPFSKDEGKRSIADTIAVSDYSE